MNLARSLWRIQAHTTLRSGVTRLADIDFGIPLANPLRFLYQFSGGAPMVVRRAQNQCQQDSRINQRSIPSAIGAYQHM
jgi:hypothetical protein